MVTYTVSLNFIENLKGPADSKYLLNILFTILNSNNDYKIAIDKDGLILDIYKEAINSSFKAEIAVWVNLIGIHTSSVQKTIAEIASIKDKKNICQEICKQAKGSKKLIIYSYDFLDNLDIDNCISYNNCRIPVIDKDDADREINPTNINNNYNYYNVKAKKSKVAIHGIIK